MQTELPDVETATTETEDERAMAALGDTLAVYEGAYFEVLAAQEKLKAAEAHLRDLGENLVPEAMAIAGVKSATLPGSGFPVNLTDHIHAGITSKNRAEAVDWLSRNGYAALLKYEFTVKFGLKEDERALAFQRMVEKLLPAHNMRVIADTDCLRLAANVKALMDESFPERKLEINLSIPGPTLKKFVTTNLRNGIPLPEMFGSYIVRFATVTPPKTEKNIDFGEGEE